MFRKKYYIVFTLLLLFFQATHAQVKDAGLWMSLNAEKKITPALSFTLAEEFRLNENMTEMGEFFTDAGFIYKINKNIRVAANYRFINKRRLDDSYSKRHWYYFDLTLRKKFTSVIISFRTRFESQYKDINSSYDGKVPAFYSRNKLTLKLDLNKKYSPYFYSEIYTPIDIPKEEGVLIDNTRYCLGIDYKFNRVHEMDVFYLIEKEYNVKKPKTNFIIGLGYYYIF